LRHASGQRRWWVTATRRSSSRHSPARCGPFGLFFDASAGAFEFVPETARFPTMTAIGRKTIPEASTDVAGYRDDSAITAQLDAGGVVLHASPAAQHRLGWGKGDRLTPSELEAIASCAGSVCIPGESGPVKVRVYRLPGSRGWVVKGGRTNGLPSGTAVGAAPGAGTGYRDTGRQRRRDPQGNVADP